MKAAIISFTARGALKNRELAALLRKKLSCTGYSFYKYALEGQTAFREVRSLTETLFLPAGFLSLSVPQESPCVP